MWPLTLSDFRLVPHNLATSQPCGLKKTGVAAGVELFGSPKDLCARELRSRSCVHAARELLRTLMRHQIVSQKIEAGKTPSSLSSLDLAVTLGHLLTMPISRELIQSRP